MSIVFLHLRSKISFVVDSSLTLYFEVLLSLGGIFTLFCGVVSVFGPVCHV